MGVLDALIYGVRDLFDGSGKALPRRSRVKFTGAVTDLPDEDLLLVDTGPGNPVSTLCGDGTVANESHIVGDAIVWAPIDVPGLYVTELAGKVDTNADATPTSIALFTPANLNGYAIDVTATAYKPASGVWEKWKLTCSVGRNDAHAGLTKSNDTLFADATDALATTLEIDSGLGNAIKVILSGGVVVLELADNASGPYGWTYTARIHRDDRS